MKTKHTLYTSRSAECVYLENGKQKNPIRLGIVWGLLLDVGKNVSSFSLYLFNRLLKRRLNRCQRKTPTRQRIAWGYLDDFTLIDRLVMKKALRKVPEKLRL